MSADNKPPFRPPGPGNDPPGAVPIEDGPHEAVLIEDGPPEDGLTAPRNIKLTLAYDGTGLRGWQRQSAGAGTTVQGLLEEALARVCGHRVTVHGSGRTDAGVHARAQTASFLTRSRRTAKEIAAGGNSLLPPAVVVLAAEEVPPDFNARFSAKGKTYAYVFSTSPLRDPFSLNRAWRVGPKIDWEAVGAALPFLLGEQDFSAFQSAGSETLSPVRTMTEASLSHGDNHLTAVRLTGSGFLRHMVRTAAGTLWLVGRGKMPPEAVGDVIASRDRSKAGPVAPPQGLYLEKVYY